MDHILKLPTDNIESMKRNQVDFEMKLFNDSGHMEFTPSSLLGYYGCYNWRQVRSCRSRRFCELLFNVNSLILIDVLWMRIWKISRNF